MISLDEYPFRLICPKCEGDACYMGAIPISGRFSAKYMWLQKEERKPSQGDILSCQSCGNVFQQGDEFLWGMRK